MKQDVINLCIDQGLATFHAVNDSFLDFVRECGGAVSLPEKFTLDMPTMKALECEIEQAIVDGNLIKTEKLCDEYAMRFGTFIARWREQINRKVAA